VVNKKWQNPHDDINAEEKKKKLSGYEEVLGWIKSG
jgi:hypothetical protein